MSPLNLDILFEIISHMDEFPRRERQDILSNLALVSSDLNGAIRPKLFGEVRWPHGDKHDEESGLHFFPEVLWSYIQ